MKILLSLTMFLGLLFAIPAYADTLDVRGLTAEQIAQLNNKIVELKATPAATPSATTVEEINKYAELGKNIGVGLASTAREMGVAVNDFSQTPVGKISMFIIVYKLVGGNIISLLLGTVWFILLLGFWNHYFKKICLVQRIDEKFNDAGKRISRTTAGFGLDNGAVAGYRFVMFILLGICSIPGWVLLGHGL